MKDESYISLRNEWISIFSSFRNLMTAQIAAVIVIVYNIVNTEDSSSIPILSLTLTIILYLVTALGKSWFKQAVRQVAYIFVAYELNAYSKPEKNYKNNASLWILANRSQGYFQNLKMNDKYFAGFEFQLFYVQQILFTTLNCFIICFHKNGLNFTSQQHEHNEIALLVILILNICLLSISIINAVNSRNTSLNLTNDWIDYFLNRDRLDKEYLEKSGFNQYVSSIVRKRLLKNKKSK